MRSTAAMGMACRSTALASSAWLARRRPLSSTRVLSAPSPRMIGPGNGAGERAHALAQTLPRLVGDDAAQCLLGGGDASARQVGRVDHGHAGQRLVVGGRQGLAGDLDPLHGRRGQRWRPSRPTIAAAIAADFAAPIAAPIATPNARHLGAERRANGSRYGSIAA